ncbi:hypothetical protein Bpfe_030867 [Biomphalaria pfeifferi]|uniref:Uncharacterized protein n=1 Tax=Biomphalaria pfeifferi TaxID=112525 RepID=A0AAD8ARS3_BIOPF|nr:hypothetical protein Bpfe_030867 [Biomphalaria pfeifferi]
MAVVRVVSLTDKRTDTQTLNHQSGHFFPAYIEDYSSGLEYSPLWYMGLRFPVIASASSWHAPEVAITIER